MLSNGDANPWPLEQVAQALLQQPSPGVRIRSPREP